MAASDKPTAARNLAGAAVLVLLLVIVVQAWAGRSLEHRLDSAGWELHKMANCDACDMQEAMLENKHVPRRVPCTTLKTAEGTSARTAEREVLAELGQTVCAENTGGYPMWYNRRTGQRVYGIHGRESLEHMAGY